MRLDKMNLDDIDVNFFEGGLSDLPSEQRKEYLSLYLLYRKLFTRFIMKKINLKQVDNHIKNSDLHFIPTKEEDMDIYQYLTSDELSFFYLRNNIYLENLSEEELNFLKDILYNKQPSEIQIDEFIEKTYPRTIFNDLLKNKKTYTVFYGPETMNYAAKNNALVIGMRYDSFNRNGLDEEKYMTYYYKQRRLLKDLFKKVSLDFEKKLNIPCCVIEYNEFSIQPKKSVIR